MKIIRKGLGIGALVLALSGCDEYVQRDYIVDLDCDKQQELVYHKYVSHRNSVSYELYTVSNDESKLIFRTNAKFFDANSVKFNDFDGDGDLDLIFNKYVSYGYDTFIAKNDGKGNFSEPILIYRRKVR